MIREVRSVVYEEKEADRGLAESKRLTERGYLSRWMPEGSSTEDLKASLQAYEVMRPKVDAMANTYNVSTTTFNDVFLSSFNQK
jgi:hypothetical protein